MVSLNICVRVTWRGEMEGKMKVIKSKISDVLIIKPDVHEDFRGHFIESYNKRKYEELGICVDFVQDNISFSKQKGTIRGLHWQNVPMAQTKLVSCTKGKVIDVAVDIRKGSPAYGEWISVELSEENKLQFFIPQGFAHGFLTLTDNVEFRYKVDNFYSKNHDRGIRYDDPTIGIDWELFLKGMTPILSDKDKESLFLKEVDCNLIYNGDI